MSQYPYLPLFVTDYRSATDHLTDAEHGIYLQLLMLMWQSPDCRIPDNDEWLARRFRRHADAVRSHVRPLIQEFCVIRSGWILQKRLQQEWHWRKAKSEKNSDAAKSRWNKEKRISERNATTHSERNAPTLSYPTPQKEKKDSMVANATARESRFDEFWKAFPRRQGSNPKKPAQKKFDLLIAKGTDANAIILGAANYAAELRRDGKDRTQYVAQAVTWLNQSRFEDYQTTGAEHDQPRSGGLVAAGRKLLAELQESRRANGVGPETTETGGTSNGASDSDVRLLSER